MANLYKLVIDHLGSVQCNHDQRNRFDSKIFKDASGLLRQLQNPGFIIYQVSVYHVEIVPTYMVTQKADQSNSKVLQLKSSKHEMAPQMMSKSSTQ